MSANVRPDGTVVPLDRAPEAGETMSEARVKEPKTLAAYLLRFARDLRALRKRWAPDRLDFEDVVSTGTAASPQTVRLEHHFGKAVRWWMVRCTAAGSVTVPLINETTGSDDNTLVLSVYFPATLTIRVEEAG